MEKEKENKKENKENKKGFKLPKFKKPSKKAIVVGSIFGVAAVVVLLCNVYDSKEAEVPMLPEPDVDEPETPDLELVVNE